MTLEQITDLASIAGTVAVVATLMFLVLQLRRNTQSLRSVATHSAHEQLSALYDQFEDSTFLDIYLRATDSSTSLSREETARLNVYFFKVDLCAQNWWFQTREGAMSRELLASWSKLIQGVATMEPWKRYWEQRRFVFAPEYVAFIEEIRTRTDGLPYKPLGTVGGDVATSVTP
jgi:hypothetical protein